MNDISGTCSHGVSRLKPCGDCMLENTKGVVIKIKELASTVSFDIEDMKRYQRLKPVQEKLDKANRPIQVIDYLNVRSPAEFMCKDCGHRWKVTKAKYVTQQNRNCPACNRGGPKKKTK